MVWTKRIDVRVGLRFAIAVALLSMQSVGASAVTLAPSTSLVGLGGICSFPAVFVVGSGLCPQEHLGVSAAADITLGTGERLQLDAAASTSGPVASVQGELSAGRFGVGSAEAQVDYEVAVAPIGGLVLPVSSVPVTLMANVEAQASGVLGASESFAFARAEAPFGAIQACGNLPSSACVDSPTNSVSGNVAPNAPISLDVLAVGSFGANPSSFLASADPVFAIADELIPGTNVNFRDAFTVLVSPGVTQSLGAAPAAIPEPTTSALLGAGLTALWFAHPLKRKRT